MNPRVICCGTIAYDLISDSDHKGSGLSFSAEPGGSVLNTAVILARLGVKVSMLSKTGNDPLGDTLLAFMRSEGLDISRIKRVSSAKTSLAFALIDKKGDPSYIFYRSSGPDIAVTYKDLPFSLIDKSEVFHTGSGSSYDDHSFQSTLNLLLKAKKRGLFISFDPNWRASRIKDRKTARSRIKTLIENSDLLKMSGSDALGITGRKTLDSAVRCLPSKVVITMGKRGSFFQDGKARILCPAFNIKTVDTIGAGDAFNSGLIYKYCLSGKGVFWEQMRENLKFASAVSALASRSKGATRGIKNSAQVRHFLLTSNRR